jgi:transcription antitermination factor NusG
MSGIVSEYPWYAVAVRSRHEKVVDLGLSAKGYYHYLPLYASTHRSGRGFRAVQLPLFGGYVFASFDASRPLPILQIPGVLYVVRNGKWPTAVDESELKRIQLASNSGLDVEPSPFLASGDWVSVERGALRGMEGLLVSVKGKSRLVLSISLLQRSISVEVDSSSVRLLRRASGDAPELSVAGRPQLASSLVSPASPGAQPKPLDSHSPPLQA